MILYFSIFTVLLLFAMLDLAPIKKKHKYPIYYAVFIFFTFMAGLRWRTGADWLPYYYYYVEFNLNSNFTKVAFEPGYLALNWFAHLISDKYTSLLICSAIITSTLQSTFYRRYVNYILLALFLYYCNYMFDVFTTRQAIAMALGLANVINIIKRRVVLYYLLVIVAMLFHASAVVLLFAYPIFHMNWGTRSKFVWLVAAILIGFTGAFTALLSYVGSLGFLGRLSEKADQYSEIGSGVVAGGGSALVIKFTGLAKRAMILPIFLFYERKFKDKGSLYKRFMNLFVFGNIIYFLVLEFYSVQRMATYFYYYEIILICMIVQRSRYRYLWFAFFALYGFVKLFFIVHQTAPYIVPYRSIYYEGFIPRPGAFNF